MQVILWVRAACLSDHGLVSHDGCGYVNFVPVFAMLQVLTSCPQPLTYTSPTAELNSAQFGCNRRGLVSTSAQSIRVFECSPYWEPRGLTLCHAAGHAWGPIDVARSNSSLRTVMKEQTAVNRLIPEDGTKWRRKRNTEKCMRLPV